MRNNNTNSVESAEDDQCEEIKLRMARIARVLTAYRNGDHLYREINNINDTLATNQEDAAAYSLGYLDNIDQDMSGLCETHEEGKKSKRTYGDAPNTMFSGDRSSNQYYDVAVGEMQGWRARMEDGYFSDIEFAREAHKGHGFFCVFDGHSGSKCATKCQELFPLYASAHLDNGNIDFERMYLAVDAALRPLLKKDRSGCTAVAVHVSPSKITCASVGDSRAVLCRQGMAIPLSQDDKPELIQERCRIAAAGGYVYNNRVNGNLAMSRSLGDFGYKQRKDLSSTSQLVIALPNVISIDRNLHADSFIVLACDGIFDVLTNEEIIQMICDLKNTGKSNLDICKFLCDYCLAPSDKATGLPCRRAGTDNMTLMIVDLLAYPGDLEVSSK